MPGPCGLCNVTLLQVPKSQNFKRKIKQLQRRLIDLIKNVKINVDHLFFLNQLVVTELKVIQ